MTSSDKAFDTSVKNASRKIAKEIADLPSDCNDLDVLVVIKAQTCNREVLSTAFHLLDTQPLKFANPEKWHPRLRRLRNNTEVGQNLVTIFGGEL